MRYVAVWLLVVGCTGRGAATEPPPVREVPRKAIASRTIDLPGDSRGIVWDAAESRLFLTNDTASSIVQWTERDGFVTVGLMPPSERPALGGLVKLADGRLVTTSFGFGVDGAVFVLGPKGAVDLPLDPARRRNALAHAGEAVFVSYFTVTDNRYTGGIARLDMARGEADVIAQGLVKPVGVAASATTLYVADSDQHALFAYTLADLSQRRVVTTALDDAELLTLLPNGDLVTGGKGGDLRRITAAGAISTIADGFEHVRGTAYDAAGGRLFVVEHSVASSRHRLHILDSSALD